MSPRLTQRPQGFSLVELLIVIAMLGILTALAAPGLLNVKKHNDLQVAAGQVMEHFELARQSARTLNRTVEVRVYLATNVNTTDGVQSFLPGATPAKAEPLQRKYQFPMGVGISRSTTFSSLLLNADTGVDAKNNAYYSFLFRANGLTNLPTGKEATLTVVLANEINATTLPPNFGTIAIDPALGRAKLFRP